FIADVQIGPAIVVGIEPDRGERRAVAAGRPTRGGDFLELPVALVAEQQIAALPAALAVEPGADLGRAQTGHIEIEPAVRVVVGDGNAETIALQVQVAQMGYVLKPPTAFVAVNPPIEDEVVPAIPVQIGEGRY